MPTAFCFTRAVAGRHVHAFAFLFEKDWAQAIKMADPILKVKFVLLFLFAASSCLRFRRFLDLLCKGRNVYTQTSRLDAMKLSEAAHSRILKFKEVLSRGARCHTRFLCLHSLRKIRKGVGRIKASYVNSWDKELGNKFSASAKPNILKFAWLLAWVCFCWKTI